MYFLGFMPIPSGKKNRERVCTEVNFISLKNHSWIIWLIYNFIELPYCKMPQNTHFLTWKVRKPKPSDLLWCSQMISFPGLHFSHAASWAILLIFKSHSIYYSSAILDTGHIAMNTLDKAPFTWSSHSSVKGMQQARKLRISDWEKYSEENKSRKTQ